MPKRERKKKEDKRDEKYRLEIAKQVDAAIERRQKSAAAQAKRQAKGRRALEAHRTRKIQETARRQAKTTARRAFRVKMGNPIAVEDCGPPPLYLERLPAVWEQSQRRVGPAEKRRAFLRSFGLTALLLACPLFALWGMGQAYEAVRVNGFADYTTPLDVVAENNVWGIRIFDFVLRSDRLPAGVQWLVQVIWQLAGPAVQLICQFLQWVPRLLLRLLHALV